MTAEYTRTPNTSERDNASANGLPLVNCSLRDYGDDVDASHFDVLIVGGGTAGITVAARLRRLRPSLRVGLLEPSETHYYQPLFTLVGGGAFPMRKTHRPVATLIPRGVQWIKASAKHIDAANKLLSTTDGQTMSYDYLVVCPGLKTDWEKIKGLEGTVGKHGICSNYHTPTVDQTWAQIKNFRGGTALFTFPNTPVKCGGAPQKIMYLAEEHFRRAGIRDRCTVEFCSAASLIFAVPKYADVLNKIITKRGINTHFHHDLVEVDAANKRAHFRHLQTGEIITKTYDLIHVTPPMSAPRFIVDSALANANGWLDLDKLTLRHVTHPHIYGLGDASSLPTSKTGAAIRKQAPVVVANLLAQIDGKQTVATYDGYTSCPIVTGYGKLILAEFDYSGTPRESFPFNQAKERLSMYLLKKYLLPKLYWYAMLKGWS